MVKNSAELIDSLRTKAAAAKEERAKIDAIFSSIGEGLIATDENGSVTRINQVALDMLGYKESEVIGEWYPEKIILVNEDGSVIETIERPMTQVFMTGKAVSSRKYYQKKNGTIFPVFITVSPIFLKGKPIGAI